MIPNPNNNSGGSNAENLENTTFYQPISIHQIINDLNKERQFDSSSFKQENSANIISDHLQETTTIESLLITPTVKGNDSLIAKILEVVNEDGLPVARSFLGNTVVEPGKIRIVQTNGVIRVVGPGM